MNIKSREQSLLAYSVVGLISLSLSVFFLFQNSNENSFSFIFLAVSFFANFYALFIVLTLLHKNKFGVFAQIFWYIGAIANIMFFISCIFLLLLELPLEIIPTPILFPITFITATIQFLFLISQAITKLAGRILKHSMTSYLIIASLWILTVSAIMMIAVPISIIALTDFSHFMIG